MGAISSAQRDSKRDESTVSEPSAGQDEAQEDSAAEKLLQKNGQISSLNGKTESQPDELNVPLEDVGSGYVTLKEEDDTKTEDLQECDTSQTNTEELAKEPLSADGVTVKEVEEICCKQNDIEVGFKKMFKFVGFKFTLKKDKVPKTNKDEPATNEQDNKVAISSEDSRDTTKDSPVSTNQQDADETKEGIIEHDIQEGSKDDDVSPETDQEMAISQITEILEHNEEETPPGKEQMEEVPQSPEPEEPMSPIKRFFTQGIFASLRKKRKEEALKEEPEEELVKTDNEESEKLSATAQEDSSCICLNISNILPEENKDLQTDEGDEQKPAGEKEQTVPPEQDKVPASPLIRLFRKLSTRRQRDTKPAETSLIEPGENVCENVQSTTELVKALKEEEEAMTEEPKPADADEITDLSPEESKKKSDSTVSWESLICLKRARKTSGSEDAMQDNGEEPRKSTESPIGSSSEGDYDHLTSSNEQAGEESGSTWKSLKKLVTPKKKARMEESGSSEQIPSDTEITKDESSCSIKKLIPGRKKRRSDGQQEQLSSEDTGKGTGADDEDDETPAVVPLSEFEVVEPESLKEIKDGTDLEKEVQPMNEEDKPKVTKPLVIATYEVRPSVMPIPSDYIEDLTEFLSKHQQLSDIPEEGFIEESVATPVSSSEWTTQDDTLAEDFVELTADAVTAPEPASEHGDDTTEMVSAVSQLTESPKTSGNVTPVSPEYDLRDADVIIQEAVEASCMTPSVMSVTTKDKEPEALAVSVSPCILGSTISAETKVLVAHEKAEASTICIGVVSQEIRAVEEIIPSPLVEGISELNEAVPTELVSEDVTEGSELAGLATDDVYEVEVKEIKTEVHEALSPDVPQTPSEVNLEVQKDEVKEYPKDVINGQQEPAPVQMAVISAVQGETPLEEQAITNSMTDVPEIEGPLKTALEELVHEQPALYTEVTVEGEKEHTLPDVKLSFTDIEHVPLAEVAESVEQNIIVSLNYSTIDEASEITEDTVQVSLAEVVETASHNAVASGPETAIDEAIQITEAKAGVLASAVERPETTEAISIVSTVSDSIKAEAVVELEEELQMENVASIRYGDGHEIQVEVKGADLATAKANVDTVLDAATAVDKADIYEKVEEIEDDGTSQQQIEPTPAEESCEHFAEETVPNIKMEVAAEPPCKENELNIVVKDVSPSAATTDEPEHVDTNVTPVEDHKPVDMTLLNEVEKQIEITQVPVFSEPTLLQKESVEESQPIRTDKPEEIHPENQMVEFIVDAHKTEVTAESVDEVLTKTEIETTCKDAEVAISDTLSEDRPEQKEETAKPEISPEFAAGPQDVLEPVALSVKTEVDKAQQPQADSVPSKPEENQETESSLKLHTEDKQVADEVAPKNVEETKQFEVVFSTNVGSNETKQICEVEKSPTSKPEERELEISEQKGAAVQHLEETLSEDKTTETTTEAIKVEAPLVISQEPEALATSAIQINDIVEETKPQQEVVSGLNSEISTGSDQHIAASASEINKEPLEVKDTTTTTISEPEKEESTEQTTEQQKATENKSETLTVQHAQVQVLNEHKAEALEVIEVETNVETEVKMETALVTENEVEKPVVTSLVTELEVETPVVTSLVRDLKADAPVITSVVSDLKVETPVVTLVTEPEADKTVVTPPVTEPEAAKTVLITVVTEPEANKTVDTSVVIEPEADKTVVTSVGTEPEADKTVVTSAVTVPEADKTLVTSAVTVPETDKTLVTSAVTLPEANKTLVTSVVTVPETDKTLVTSVVTMPETDKTVVTSVVTVLEADKPVVTVVTETPEVPTLVTVPEADKTVTSTVPEPEVGKTEVTSTLTVPEANKTVVTSMVPEPEVGKTEVTSTLTVPEANKTVVTSMVPEPEADKTVVQSVVTEPEADKIVVQSVVTEPEADKIVVQSVVPEPEADKTVVQSVVTEPEADKTVVQSVVTEPEADKIVVQSVVTESEVDKTVVPSVVTDPKAETLVGTTVVQALQVEPAVPQRTTVEGIPRLQETPTVVPDMQTAVVPELQTQMSDDAEIVAVIKENDVKVKTPVVVEITEPTFELPAAAEVVIQTAVSELEADLPDVTSALITETVVQTYVEKKLEIQSTVVVPAKEEKVMETPMITNDNVILEQKPEVPAAMPELSQTQPETSDAAAIASHKVTEIKAETIVVTEVEVKTPAVASVTTVKKEEAPVAASVVKEPATAAPVIETPTLIEKPTIVPAAEKPTVVQIPPVVPAVQTVGVVVKEAVQVVAPEVKDIHKEASSAVTVEVKPSQMEAVKVTVTTTKVTQEEDTKSPQTVSKGQTEVPVSTAKTAEPPQDVEDDVWEDAVDDIRDECSITKAGAE